MSNLPRNIQPFAPSTTGRSFLAGDCQKCEYCWTRTFGCTSTRRYCHSHQMEPA